MKKASAQFYKKFERVETKPILLYINSVFFMFFMAACIQIKSGPDFNHQPDPCSNIQDTTFYLHFSKDTSTDDFYQLLDFIESKGEFSRYNQYHKIDSIISDSILLQKPLCIENLFNSPIEYWKLTGIFSIRYNLTSTKPLNNRKDSYLKLNLIQCNFLNSVEKEKALAKITGIGWGDPLVKWNYNYIITSKTRIYILESYSDVFAETLNRYGHLLEKEWADKINR